MKKLLEGIDQVRQHIKALANERPDDCDLHDASELIQVVRRAVGGTDLLKAFGAPGDWGYDTLIGDGLLDALKTRKPGDDPAIGSATSAAADVLAERKRQIENEGFNTIHDDEHRAGDLAAAAACYALEAELKLKSVAQTKGHAPISRADHRRDRADRSRSGKGDDVTDAVAPNCPRPDKPVKRHIEWSQAEIDLCEVVWGCGDIDLAFQNMGMEITHLRSLIAAPPLAPGPSRAATLANEIEDALRDYENRSLHAASQATVRSALTTLRSLAEEAIAELRKLAESGSYRP